MILNRLLFKYLFTVYYKDHTIIYVNFKGPLK